MKRSIYRWLGENPLYLEMTYSIFSILIEVKIIINIVQVELQTLIIADCFSPIGKLLHCNLEIPIVVCLFGEWKKAFRISTFSWKFLKNFQTLEKWLKVLSKLLTCSCRLPKLLLLLDSFVCLCFLPAIICGSFLYLCGSVFIILAFVVSSL